MTKKEVTFSNKPWITKGIHKSIKTKDYNYGKFVKTKRLIWYNRYKYFRDLLNKLIRRSKKIFLKTK